ncbi:MAG: LytTR family transcriptional regulator DNA-binding domain-containing protein [Leadbetterella sp.]|nr:LytTR family transcriptional regulator DNA-binding domain-containing protein [Leadbetterella sp.]
MRTEYKVLLLDDDPFFEISLGFMFLDTPYQIIKTIDSLVHLDDSLIKHKVDLFICNVFVQGNYLYKSLFLDLKRRGIPVICITSVNEDIKYEEWKDTVQGYLVKPFHKNSLLSLVKNCLEQSIKAKLYDFMAEKYLFLKNKGRELEKINFSEIVFLESDGNYCYINTITKRYVEKKSLTKILKEKLDKRFRRIHQKYAVNSEYLERVDRFEVKLTNTVLPLSDTFRHTLNDITKSNFV